MSKRDAESLHKQVTSLTAGYIAVIRSSPNRHDEAVVLASVADLMAQTATASAVPSHLLFMEMVDLATRLMPIYQEQAAAKETEAVVERMRGDCDD